MTYLPTYLSGLFSLHSRLSLLLGIFLERTRCTGIIKQGTVTFTMTRRKGRPVYEHCPIHAMDNGAFSPIYCLGAYLDLASSYTAGELFVSFKASKKPTVAGPIDSLTSTFLRNMQLHELTAHSTRGALATARILPGGDPHVDSKLGDWQN